MAAKPGNATYFLVKLLVSGASGANTVHAQQHAALVPELKQEYASDRETAPVSIPIQLHASSHNVSVHGEYGVVIQSVIGNAEEVHVSERGSVHDLGHAQAMAWRRAIATNNHALFMLGTNGNLSVVALLLVAKAPTRDLEFVSKTALQPTIMPDAEH